MNVLIIEDSDYKIRSITDLLVTISSHLAVSVAKSFQSGLRKILDDKPELIILDMTLPTSDQCKDEPESRNRPFGGEELMREIEIENIRTKVIIVTQFDQFPTTTGSIDHNTIFRNMRQEFPAIFFGGVYYNVIDATWEKNLKYLVQSVLKK